MLVTHSVQCFEKLGIPLFESVTGPVGLTLQIIQVSTPSLQESPSAWQSGTKGHVPAARSYSYELK
jgi:hypothetical protein